MPPRGVSRKLEWKWGSQDFNSHSDIGCCCLEWQLDLLDHTMPASVPPVYNHLMEETPLLLYDSSLRIINSREKAPFEVTFVYSNTDWMVESIWKLNCPVHNRCIIVASQNSHGTLCFCALTVRRKKKPRWRQSYTVYKMSGLVAPEVSCEITGLWLCICSIIQSQRVLISQQAMADE